MNIVALIDLIPQYIEGRLNSEIDVNGREVIFLVVSGVVSQVLNDALDTPQSVRCFLNQNMKVLKDVGWLGLDEFVGMVNTCGAHLDEDG